MRTTIFAILAVAGMVACGETRTVSDVNELYEALADLSNKSSMNYIVLNESFFREG